MVARKHRHPHARVKKRHKLCGQVLVAETRTVEGQVARNHQGRGLLRQNLGHKGVEQVLAVKHNLTVAPGDHRGERGAVVGQARRDVMGVRRHDDATRARP